MDNKEMKCVMVVDGELPVGMIANTTAILGATLGKHAPEQIGPDVKDASGRSHMGIVTIPITVLRGDGALLKELRERLYGEAYSALLVVDFSDVAQSCNVYSEYQAKAAATAEEDHRYFGVAVYGSKKLVNKLTGSMPLLR